MFLVYEKNFDFVCGREGICVIDTRFLFFHKPTQASSERARDENGVVDDDGGVRREEVTKQVELRELLCGVSGKSCVVEGRVAAAAFNDREK